MTSKQLLFNSFLESSYSPEDRSAQSWVIIFPLLYLQVPVILVVLLTY
ncbi:hypothetical protein CRD_02094 [Raphidiopsis brookii D9]|nr:hypothetical protein CRD_02094 [Raphidiopsis brookii D9]